MNFEQAVASGGPWALPFALAGGVLAGLNPCCLGLYPAVFAAVCMADGEERSRMMPWRLAAFLIGTAIATALLGILAASAGHAVTVLGRWPQYAVALVLVLIGLALVGWLPLRFPIKSTWFLAGATVPAAFVAGLVLSLMVSYCATPLFIAILSLAVLHESVAFGALLLLLYAIGNSLPMLIAGTGAAALLARVDQWREWGNRAAGIMVVGMAFLLILRN